MDKPVTYVVTEKILLNDADGNCRVVEAGSEVSYTGLPSANMLPTCPEGEKRRAQAVEYDKKGRFENAPPIENIGEAERQAAAEATEKAKARAKAVAKAKKEENELA